MTPAVYTSAQWDGEYGVIFFTHALRRDRARLLEVAYGCRGAVPLVGAA